MRSEVHRCKCVVVGDAGVGKTSLVQSLVGKEREGGSFPLHYNMTPGVEIQRKSMRVSEASEGRVAPTVEFFIYDFSGKALYADLVRQIWSNNVSVVVGVLDVTREESLTILTERLKQLWQQISRPQDVVGIIVGNKTDLSARRCVSVEEAASLAKSFHFRYFDLSCKTDAAGVHRAFLHLTTAWLLQHRLIGGSSGTRVQQDSSTATLASRSRGHRRSLSVATPSLLDSDSTVAVLRDARQQAASTQQSVTAASASLA